MFFQEHEPLILDNTTAWVEQKLLMWEATPLCSIPCWRGDNSTVYFFPLSCEKLSSFVLELWALLVAVAFLWDCIAAGWKALLSESWLKPVIQTGGIDLLTFSYRTELLFQPGKLWKEGRQRSRLRKKADPSSLDLFFISATLATVVNTNSFKIKSVEQNG